MPTQGRAAAAARSASMRHRMKAYRRKSILRDHPASDPTQPLTTLALMQAGGQTFDGPPFRMPGQAAITSMTHVTPNRSVSIP
jgi:hypothetical protein